MTSEKLCLRWNDFERNISEAFRKIRDDKDFFDITLVCEEEQIQAHKIILSACSPFFKKVLQNHHHSHPLIYLKGVNYKDLEDVLSFMYHGQVNVAQEELNSFLQVAEDLKVKGLGLDTVSDRTLTTDQKTSKNSISSLIPKPNASLSRPTFHDPTFSPMPGHDDHDMPDVGSIVKSEPCDNPPADGIVNNHSAIVMYNKDAGEVQYGPCQAVVMPEAVGMDNSYGDGPMMIEGQESVKQECFETDQQCDIYLNERKLFPCEQCEKQFSHRGGLHLHIKSVHEGVRHPCELCEYKATTKGGLKVHVQAIHEGIRYPCEQCIYKATTKDRLNIHVQTVHEGIRYPCNLCEYQATERQKLNKHIKFVHEGIGFSCEYCEYKTQEKRKLRSHIEKRHFIEEKH